MKLPAYILAVRMKLACLGCYATSLLEDERLRRPLRNARHRVKGVAVHKLFAVRLMRWCRRIEAVSHSVVLANIDHFANIKTINGNYFS